MRTRLCLRGTRLRRGELAHLLLLWAPGLSLTASVFGLRVFGCIPPLLPLLVLLPLPLLPLLLLLPRPLPLPLLLHLLLLR